MICPDCQNGVVLVLRGQSQSQDQDQVRHYGGTTFLPDPEKYFDKIPCPRCNGSGTAYSSSIEYTTQADAFFGGPIGAGDTSPLVG